MAVSVYESSNIGAISDITRAYIAGFVDGEAYIGIELKSGKYHKITVTTTQRNPAQLHLMKQVFGGTVDFQVRKGKRLYRHRISNQLALRMLGTLKQYLVVKSEEVDVAFEFGATLMHWNKIPDPIFKRREELLWRMRGLKRREFIND